MPVENNPLETFLSLFAGVAVVWFVYGVGDTRKSYASNSVGDTNLRRGL